MSKNNNFKEEEDIAKSILINKLKEELEKEIFFDNSRPTLEKIKEEIDNE